jgi:hypothetical protein
MSHAKGFANYTKITRLTFESPGLRRKGHEEL